MRSGSLNLGEIFAALVLIGLGGFIVWEASAYPIGTLQRMGPGFFPVSLGVILILLGGAIAVSVMRSETPPPDLPWHAFLMVLAGLVAFALTVDRFGLVPATVALVCLSALGDRPVRPLAMLGLSATLALVGYFLFVHAFGVPFDAIRW